MALEQLDCQEAQASEASQLEIIVLPRSTSKKCIMNLIVFHKNVNKRNITQDLLELEGGGAHDFVGGDNHKGWRRGCEENLFSKSRSIKLHKDWPPLIFFVFSKKLPNV